ncbi:Holliday junction resolvase RecU [Helicovermis profundi]|uniref:Holliday junction resolvase RecU n=1 Tax=Helicovermis profundi TaxID=3065157 RepID=A0AAU9E3A3_9FIRM|nr:hypothetical protein HLPR_00340 [Clostridia bacterium S502]
MTIWNSRGLRGSVLEDLLTLTNEFYKQQKLARIDKISVPIKVTEIDKNRNITKAFFEKKSTVDFLGIIQGIAVAYDAKETNLKSIPLKNIHKHQIEFMKDYSDQSGLSFLIVHFKIFDEYFVIPFELLYTYYIKSENGERKSIPYKSIPKEYLINRPTNGILNYLPVLNTYLKNKKNNLNNL